MFDVGFSELIVIGVVALLVIGPEKLPRVARESALWLRKARQMVHSVKREIDQELQLDDLRRTTGNIQNPIREFRDTLSQVRRDIKESVDVLDAPEAPNQSLETTATAPQDDNKS